MAADGALDAAFAHLTAMPHQAVYIDLADTEFAGTTLVNFVHRIISSLRVHTPVLLCRPRHMTRQLIELCRLDTVATISSDLPADFAAAASLLGSEETSRAAATSWQ